MRSGRISRHSLLPLKFFFFLFRTAEAIGDCGGAFLKGLDMVGAGSFDWGAGCGLGSLGRGSSAATKSDLREVKSE